MDAQALAKSIKEARKAKGWTQTRLGREAGADQSTVQRYEAGDFKEITETLRHVLHVLDLPLPEGAIGFGLAIKGRLVTRSLSKLAREMYEAGVEFPVIIQALEQAESKRNEPATEEEPPKQTRARTR